MAKSGFAKEHLRSFVDRIERLEEERSALTADIREVYSEAKGTGFDTKIMRQVIRLRRMDKDDLDEQETLLDVYKRALGMLPEADRVGRKSIMAGALEPDVLAYVQAVFSDLGTSVMRESAGWVALHRDHVIA